MALYDCIDEDQLKWRAVRTDDPRVHSIRVEEAAPQILENWIAPYESQFDANIWADVVASTERNWFKDALSADSRGDTATAIDILYGHMDHLLSDGDYGEVNAILRKVSLNEASLTFLMAILSITLPATEHLPLRATFFENVWSACARQGRNPQKLLGGLRSWSSMDGTGLRNRR